MKYEFVKTLAGALVPASDEASSAIKRVGAGEIVMVDLKRRRNISFHRKYFALINMAYDLWCSRGLQAREYRGTPVLPNKNRFRKDLTILAGYYEPTYAYDGSLRLEAKSIAFESMGEDEFEELYSATIDVILNKVIPDAGLTEERVREAVNEVAGYV